MTKRKALSSKNRPRGLHLSMYLVAWLVVDRFGIDGWQLGAIATFFAILFVATLVDFFAAKDVEL